MKEPWKSIICDDPACFFESVNADGTVKEEARIYPEIDTPEFTQFKCPRCAKIETWGVTRRKVAQTLYERAGYAGVGK